MIIICTVYSIIYILYVYIYIYNESNAPSIYHYGTDPANDKELEVPTPCAAVNVRIFAIPIPTIL